MMSFELRLNGSVVTKFAVHNTCREAPGGVIYSWKSWRLGEGDTVESETRGEVVHRPTGDNIEELAAAVLTSWQQEVSAV